MRENKRNNKGFSLVELIVVIAIMIVLVAVLAPVFTRYVEQSRRGTDVQNANSIAEAVLIDVADGKLADDLMGKTITVDTATEGSTDKYLPSSIKSVPKTSGNAVAKGANFTFNYDSSTNTVTVSVAGAKNTVNLTTEEGATDYRDASAGDLATASN